MRCVAGWAGGRRWVAGRGPAGAAFPGLRTLLLPLGQAAVNGAEGAWVGSVSGSHLGLPAGAGTANISFPGSRGQTSRVGVVPDRTAGRGVAASGRGSPWGV